MEPRIIGTSVPRKEGRDKVTGAARYIDDISFPEMIYGLTVRSPAARGLSSIFTSTPKIPWNEFTIVTAKDIPGKNCIVLIIDDQPALADKIVNHPEEPIRLARASLTNTCWKKHAERCESKSKRHTGRFHASRFAGVKGSHLGRRQILKSIHVEKGEVDAAWSKAAFHRRRRIRNRRAGAALHRTQGVIAIANPGDGVTVWGSLQCPYYVHKALIVFGLPEEKMRVVQTETGGGFGGKEEYPSMIAAHAALLAWKSGSR